MSEDTPIPTVSTSDAITLHEVVEETAVTTLPKPEAPGSHEALMRFCENVIQSGVFPEGLNTPQKLYIVIRQGQELGLPAMASINNIHVINSRATLSVHAIGYLLKRAGIYHKTIKNGEKVVIKYKDPKTGADKEYIDRVTTIRFYRKAPELGVVIEEDVTFTWQEAQIAGWTEKKTWVSMPNLMLWNRCFAIGARRVAPDALLGFYEDSEWADAKGANYQMDDEGHVKLIS